MASRFMAWPQVRVWRRGHGESVARQDGAARLALYKFQESRSRGLVRPGVNQHRDLLERRMKIGGYKPALAVLHIFRARRLRHARKGRVLDSRSRSSERSDQ